MRACRTRRRHPRHRPPARPPEHSSDSERCALCVTPCVCTPLSAAPYIHRSYREVCLSFSASCAYRAAPIGTVFSLQGGMSGYSCIYMYLVASLCTVYRLVVYIAWSHGHSHVASTCVCVCLTVSVQQECQSEPLLRRPPGQLVRPVGLPDK